MSNLRNSPSAAATASRTRAALASKSRCAPPNGSSMTSSTNFARDKSAAVTFIASAACGALSALRHRIEAQPSGEITA